MTGVLNRTYLACLSYLKSRNLNLEFARQPVKDDYSLFQSTVTCLNGNTFHGYSLGNKFDSAFKSTIEATERLLVSEFAGSKYHSTTGFALAGDLEFAKSKASEELLERDNIAAFLNCDARVMGEEVIESYPVWAVQPELALKCIAITNRGTANSKWYLNVTNAGKIHSWGSCTDYHPNHAVNEAILAALLKKSATDFNFDRLKLGSTNNMKLIKQAKINHSLIFSWDCLSLVKAHSEDVLDYSLGVRVKNISVYSVDEHLAAISGVESLINN